MKNNYAPLEKIRLTQGSAFYENRERDLEYLRLLDCDRMLYNFRKAFGCDTKGAEPLGGWEEPSGLLRGHCTGHFISALSIALSATGEEIFAKKLKYTVHELRELQKMSRGNPADFETLCTKEDASQEKWSRDPSVWGEGFLSAYSPDQFALLEKLTEYSKIWAPYYTLHKIVSGMTECFLRTGNGEALECAKGIGDWIYARLSPLSAEKRREMWSLYIAGEFGGMNETMAKLYEITGEEKYLKTAEMFDNDNVFPALSRGEDAVQNRHANQHIPQIIGALEEYSATGREYYKKTAVNFFSIVRKNHMYSIGGVGQGESFRESGKLAKYIKGATNCETCAAYNLMKLARALYAEDGKDAEYMDYYERAMINQILASQTPFVSETRHNGVTYMLPIGPGEEKEYTDDYQSFTCCHGTGMENHVKYQDASFFAEGEEIYVNQYIPARLQGETEIEIKIPFPERKGKIVVSGRKRTVFFRIPPWTKNPFSLCGAPLPQNGRFAVFRHGGGCAEIDVSFEYGVRLEYTPDMLDGKRLASVLYGPFVMVTEGEEKSFMTIEKDKIEPLDGEIALTDGVRRFIPIYKMHGKRYHTYFYIK